MGLDLGQKQDFSAVAVVERDEVGCMRVRYLERMALGTPYVNVVSRVSEIMQQPELAGQSRLVVDATGVGAPVVEMLRAARPRGQRADRRSSQLQRNERIYHPAFRHNSVIRDDG